MLSIILWMALHRFILIVIALLLTAGSFVLFVNKRFEDQSGLRWGAVAVTVLFWLVSIYAGVHPVNMTSFTHLETVGQYQYQPSKVKLADSDVLKFTDVTGKQIVFPHVDEYTVKHQKTGLATNQILIKQRVINKNATKLQREYFTKVAPRIFNHDAKSSRGQLIISSANN